MVGIMRKIEKKGIFGADIYQFDSLESTNSYLLENYEKYRVGDIIWAEDQTKGRGRRQNVWHSVRGGSLTYSYLLNKEPYPIKNISQISSLALCVYLKEVYNVESKMKWPNDAMIGDKKISGILVETVEDFYVIGNGVNIVGEVEVGENGQKGASIFSNEEAPSIEEFLLRYVEYIERFLSDFSKKGFEPFYKLWRSFFWLNKKILSLKESKDGIIEVEILDLTLDGGLRVREIESGQERVIFSGEVWSR